MKSPVVLVTGAGGFIGRALCERMLSEGWIVRGVFRSAGQPLLLPAGLEPIVIQSIDGHTVWTESLLGIDTIVHLAARAHILNETAPDPIGEYRRVNTQGTERLARMAANAGVRRFIYISSIGVNGEHTHERPFTEADPPHPSRPYAISKWEAEKALQDISAETGMEAVILRPPLVYGPAVKGNLLKLMNIIDRQWPLPLGGVHNQRSFIGIENLVDVIMLSIVRPEAAGQIYLVSDGEDISTPALIRLIADYMHKQPRLFVVPHSLFKYSYGLFPPLRQKIIQLTSSLTVDSSKFRQQMRWNPSMTIRDGMKDMVLDYVSRSRNSAC